MYVAARKEYESWLKWKKERNVARRALEVKSGYDTKHASHLIRLLRMGCEILGEGKVIVKRDDADELLNIKNGGWTYDQVVEYANMMDEKMKALYESSTLPKSVDYEKISTFYGELMDDARNKYNL